MLKKISYIMFFFTLTVIFINSEKYIEKNSILLLRFHFNTGVSYSLPLTTDYNSQTDIGTINVPLSFGFDIRLKDWLSLYTGSDFIYGIHIERRTINNIKYEYYLHNMFIQIPILAKFYFLYAKDPAYSNFYIGIGGFLHIWALNYYYVVVSNGLIHSGNSYNPSHKEMPPGNIYTPVNLGFKMAIGNHFHVADRTLLGVEFFITYLLIPTVNGYYFGQYYNRNNGVIMEFGGTIGVMLSIGFDLSGNYYSY